MADLKKILGVMLATGLAGRTSKGTAFAAAAPMLLGQGKSGGGWSFTQKAGLAALAYLAYRAYSDGGDPKVAEAEAKPESGGPFAAVFRALGVFGYGKEKTEGQPQPVEMDDAKALLLIRSMIAAANADGEISTQERTAILSRLDQAGAGQDERTMVERELASPPSVDAIVREVRDPDTAEQVYMASRLALRGGTDTERSYLEYLANRLRIEPDRREKLDETA